MRSERVLLEAAVSRSRVIQNHHCEPMTTIWDLCVQLFKRTRRIFYKQDR